MRRLRSRTSLVRWIAALLLTAFLNGCIVRHWSAQPVEPTRFSSNDPPHEVRVFLTSGDVLYLIRPFIQDDSLIWSPVESGGAAERQGVPLAQVAKVEVRKVDVALTAAVIAVPLTFIVLLWVAAEDACLAACVSGGVPGP